MIDILDIYKKYWDNVSYFVVEQQMSFGKKNNTKALKLALFYPKHHVIHILFTSIIVDSKSKTSLW
jgi:hypothetical protein